MKLVNPDRPCRMAAMGAHNVPRQTPATSVISHSAGTKMVALEVDIILTSFLVPIKLLQGHDRHLASGK